MTSSGKSKEGCVRPISKRGVRDVIRQEQRGVRDVIKQEQRGASVTGRRRSGPKRAQLGSRGPGARA